jgi:hypothetical protein
MIVLTANQTLTMTLASAPASNGPIASVSYMDTGGNLPGELTELVSNTSVFTICTGPVASQVRQVGAINVYNQDTALSTFTISKVNSNGVSFPLKTTSLQPGYTLEFTTEGWSVLDTNGALQQNYNNQQSYNGWKNKLINGRFDFFQRVTSVNGTTAVINQYVADRWKLYSAQANVSCAWSPANNYIGAGYSIPLDVGPLTFNLNGTSAQNSASGLVISQYIEDITLLAGRTCTLSFYALSPNTNNMVVVEFGQYVSPTGSANGTTFTNKGVYTANVVVTGNTWSRYSVTGTFPSVNANALVSDAINQTASYVALWTDAGSSFANNTGIANGFYQNTHINFASVQLEIGPVMTPYEVRPLATELALCQRYYEKSFDAQTAPYANASTYWETHGVAYGSTQLWVNIPFKVNKRVAPSLAAYSSNNVLGAANNTWQYYNGAWNSNTANPANPFTTYFAIAITGTYIANSSYLMAGNWTADADF